MLTRLRFAYPVRRNIGSRLRALSMLWLVVAGVLSACGEGTGGTLKAGDSCTMERALKCSSATQVLECRSGILRAVPCLGPNGCLEDTGRGLVTCDQTGNRAGDACLAATEGSAKCDDARTFLKCTSGSFASTNCPVSCAEMNGQVVCR
jgi:hypothetical protein